MINTPSARIRELMADLKPRSAAAIAETLSLDKKHVHDVLRKWSKPGPRQRVHTVDRLGPRNSAHYVLGAGQNAGPRRALDPDNDLNDEALDQMHRSEPSNWPAVDVLLLNSINAMVRTGVRA